MTVQEAVEYGAAHLRKAGIIEPAREARLLLAAALEAPYLDMLTKQEAHVGSDVAQKFQNYVEARASRKPISKILGVKEFYGHSFIVSDDVLDPRPDSETLIEAVLKAYPDKAANLSILDLGTGTGCLLLTLLKEYSKARGTGIDLSTKALTIAERNASALGVIDRAAFIQGDWFESISAQSFDIIVSNPPYIPSATCQELQEEVKCYDPMLALDGGSDGLNAYREIAVQAKKFLKSNGMIFFEIGAGQLESIKCIMLAEGYYFKSRFSDLQGYTRCLAFITDPHLSKHSV